MTTHRMKHEHNGEVPAIELIGLDKFYGAFQALHGVDLAVRKGERVVVCGPSGSGKSTMIRCINRLEQHDAGSICVDGVMLTADKNRIDAIRNDVGMVFQHFNLFPHMTVLQNCTLALRILHRMPKADADARAMCLLERVRIPEQSMKYPSQLSGGQQQRVAIAHALCLRPKIMLFDEPTSALDPEMVREVLDAMIELAEEGMTMICVTHEMNFARRVADRIVFMEMGKIIEEGTPDRMFKAPEQDRTRTFFNQMNH